MRASPCPYQFRRAVWTASALDSTDDAIAWLVVRRRPGAPTDAPSPLSVPDFSVACAHEWRLHTCVIFALSSACAAVSVYTGAVTRVGAIAALALCATALLLRGRQTAAEHVVAMRGIGLSRSRVRFDGVVEQVLTLRAADVRAVLLHDGFANCSVRWFLLAEMRVGGAAELVLDRARPRLDALAKMLRSIAPLLRGTADDDVGGAASRPRLRSA